MLAASVSVLLPKIKAVNNLKLLCLSTEIKKFRFSVRIYKKKDDIKPKIIPVYAPLNPIEIDTSAISEVEDITTQPTGEDQIRQEKRSLKNRGVDDIECIFFSCIFSNVSRLLVYFILPKVLEV